MLAACGTSRKAAFNSIKVRLKRARNVLFLSNYISFNSIKVRLKPEDPLQDFVCDDFQFHKGAIETQTPHFIIYDNDRFQFHKGAIETQRHVERDSRMILSIP